MKSVPRTGGPARDVTVGRGCWTAPKSDSQTPSPNEIKTEQNLAGPKGSPLESEKDRAKPADSSPDTSDNEAKGKAAWAVVRLGRSGTGSSWPRARAGRGLGR